VSLRELKNLPLILPTAPSEVRSKLDRTFSEASFAPHVAAEADVMSTALQAVEADIGGAILPKGDFSDMPGHADLSAVRIDPAVELTASVLWLAKEPLTPAAAVVRDLLIGFVEKQCLASLPLGAQLVTTSSPNIIAEQGVSNHRSKTDTLRRGPWLRVSAAAA
jgi:LysR family nitrogen assimilation transcriptional regulator